MKLAELVSGSKIVGKNRHFLSAIIVALSVMAQGVSSHAQEDLADVISNGERSVVRIDVNSAQGSSLGSGYIVSADGIFVTNVHVLAGATTASAVFDDNRRFEIKGTYIVDPARDICVAKIDASNLTPIPIAAALPRKGEQVVALGCPHGLSFSATRGIVSAIRQRDEFRGMVGRPKAEGTWVQVDAAISGGNSGGPLINSKGQVVAMSTLGSTGDAQNLNFGISNEDISRAIELAKSATLVPLKDGVGKVEMAEVSPETSKSLITRGEIPVAAIEEYIARGRRDYKELSKDLRSAATEAKKRLETMRKGEIGIPINTNADVMISKRGQIERYHYRSDGVKRARIAEQQNYVAKLEEVRGLLKPEPSDEAVFALLMHAGPYLDPRDGNKVGFMNEAIVLEAFNEHDVIVLYNDSPYLLWVKSSVGLSPGQTVQPTPVFVQGTETMLTSTGTRAVTVLNTLTETELREAVYGKVDPALKELRTWKDSTGSFSIEAKFVKFSGGDVVLEDKTGKTMNVPIARLSAEDRQLLGK
ncbi:MAG: trypsin-like peptidase domain-containing protein [Planctomycetaceae bacterium]|nr:trypsin-like peptidase domain-containing protein [Planctomycetaceae bacterium]